MPYVFEVPTTLDALHDVIGNYATTGAEASLIVKRIHKANSIRLDRRNTEKMQNFYDVILRRCIAIGDAIYDSGDGGNELRRYQQLDSLTGTMYDMAQDAADIAAAVWSRRLGFFESAHAKRLRDAEFVHQDDDEEGEFTAWPSTGVVLALRAIGRIFPVTDLRHQVVTPALLLLGQIVGYTPVLTVHDAVIGLLCAGMLIEYTKEAKRVAPEAHGFLAGIIRLFAINEKDRRGGHPLPNLGAAAEQDSLSNLRQLASEYKGKQPPKISMEKESIHGGEMPAALLFSALHLVETSARNLAGSVTTADKEVFAEITASILALNPKNKLNPLPQVLRKKVASVASAISSVCRLDETRTPVQRRLAPSIREKAVRSLAPRLENPDKYSMSKDKGKDATQAAADRIRREYKREHKAVARELRMDASMIEDERRREQGKRDSAAKAKRQKAYSWMEGEQAAMNQQVRQGGGLLQGGGMGAAKAKAKTAKLGIKKGGKF
jgi:nucleolar protein 14